MKTLKEFNAWEEVGSLQFVGKDKAGKRVAATISLFAGDNGQYYGYYSHNGLNTLYGGIMLVESTSLQDLVTSITGVIQGFLGTKIIEVNTEIDKKAESAKAEKIVPKKDK